MKIVQILPELNEGGVERGTMELSRELVKKGYESVVISSGGKLVTQIERDGGLHVTLDVCSKNPFSAPLRIFKLYQILKKLNPDILHIRSRVPAWIVFFANKGLNLPVVSTVHGFNSVGFYSSIMTKANHVICVSNSIKTFIQKHYKTLDEKITVIPRGIDLETFNPQNIDHEFIKDFKLQHHLNDKYIITTVGRITQLKDIETFIKAIALIKDEIPNVIGLIVGRVREDKQDYFTSLQNLTQELYIKENIFFTGSVSKVAEIYSLSDVVVSCSKKPESFGRSVAEAIAMNRPVIATAHGGVLDIVKENINGYFVDIGNAKDLAQKIVMAKKLHFNGHDYIDENFSLKQMVENTTKIYHTTQQKANIFIVQTPFQLFNATEAVYSRHKNEKNILLHIHRGNITNYNQLQVILKNEKIWDEIIEIPFFTRIQKLFYPLLTISLLNYLKKYYIENLYVALYRNLSAHIINSLQIKSIILYDDGNNIFKTLESIVAKKRKKFATFQKYNFIYKTNTDFIFKSQIFSIFDLQKYQSLLDKTNKNSYSYFRTFVQSFKEDTSVYFIGSKLINNGISQETFETLIQYISSIYTTRLKYIPHRYENISYLQDLGKKFNFEVCVLNTIIEYSFISQKKYPTKLISLRSTAVDSLKAIFDKVEIDIFVIPRNKISENKQNEFHLVYENFKNKKYNLLDIKCNS